MKNFSYLYALGALCMLLSSTPAWSANLVTDSANLTPGSLPGAIVVDNTGTANYQIPLSVPPGRAGTQPDLSLVYNSGGGDGVLGVGWSLGGLSAITRGPNTELDNDASNDFMPVGVTLSDTDRFLIDGQRMVLVSNGGAYDSYGDADTEYRTEVESFSRIYARGQVSSSGPEYFEVDTKSGLKMLYGDVFNAPSGVSTFDHNSSFVPEDSPSSAVLTWSVSRIIDTAGNYIDFRYDHDSSTSEKERQQQLKEILYTYHESQTSYEALSRVEFVYASRSSVATSENSVPAHVGGATVHMTKILDTIKVQQKEGSNWTDIWEYRLVYESSPASGKPRLTAIQQVTAGGIAIKETALTYLSDTAPQYQETTIGQMNWFANSRYIPADMNGDGRTDLIHHYSLNYSDGAGDYHLVKIWQHDGVDSHGEIIWDKTDSWEVTRPLTSLGVASSGADARILQTNQLIPGDFDGDGMTDLLSISYAGENLDNGGNPMYAFRRRQLYLNEMDTVGALGRLDANGSYTTTPNWFDIGVGVAWSSGFANGYVYNGGLDKYIPVDLDKDGITEIVWIKYLNSNQTEDFHIYLWDTPKDDIYVLKNPSDPSQGFNPNKNNFFGDQTELIAFHDNNVEVWDESRAVMGDVNGDGIDDLIIENRYSAGNKTRTRIFITKRNATTGDWYLEAPSGNYDVTDSATNSWEERDVLQFADINGDGRAELIRGKPKLTNETKFYHYWGGGPTHSTTYPIFDYRYHYPHETNSNDPDYWTTELLPFWYARWWKVGVGYYAYAQNKTMYDGELDLEIYFQKGNGFDLSSAHRHEESITLFEETFTSIDDLQFFFHDETGDGKQDLVVVNVGSNNDGFVKVFASDGDPTDSNGAFSIDVYEPSEMQGFDNDAQWVITDFNGNGFPEITQLAKGANDSVHYEKYSVPGDLLKTVTNGHGETTELIHETLAEDAIYSGAGEVDYPVVNFRGPRWIVAEVLKDTGYPDGSGGDVQYRTLYTYGGARVHLQGRGFLGFQTFESYDPQTNLSKIDFLAQDYPMTGMTLQTSTYYDPDPLTAGDERILSRAENKVFFDGVVGGTYFPFVSESVEYKWTKDAGLVDSDLNPSSATSHYAKITTRNRFDAQSTFLTSQPDVDNPANFKITWGNNASVEIDYGTEEGKQTTVNSYDNSALTSTEWHLARLTRTEVTSTAPDSDSSGLLPAQTRTSSFSYYPNTGLLVSECIEPDDTSGENKLLMTHYRDAAGRITQSQSAASGEPSRYSYKFFLDDKKMFYLTTVNALGHVENKTYDYRFGSVLTLEGPNGRVTEWEYDGFGRVVRETVGVESGGLNLSTVTQYDFDDESVSIPASIEGSAYTTDALFRVTTVGPVLNANITTVQGLADLRTSAFGTVSTSYFDKMGREIRSESDQLVSGSHSSASTTYADVHVDTGYNEIGQVVCVSNPYRTSASQWTKTKFDELGRTVEVHVPGSNGAIVTKTDYNGLTTTVTRNFKQGGTSPSENQKVISTNNLRGQAVEITNDLNGDLDNTVTHAYDQFGNLIKSTSPGNQVVRMTYDLRGRKTEQVDPDMGTWSYTYNGFGDLLTQTDAKNQVTKMEYDRLGRMTDRYTDFGGTNQEHSEWYYDVVDSATDEYGQLRLEIAPDGSRRSYYYDSHGRLDFVLDKILVDDSGTTDRWKFFYTVNDYNANYGWLSKSTSYWRPISLEGLDYMDSGSWLYYATSYNTDDKGSVYSVVGSRFGVDGTTDDTLWWYDPVFNEHGQITRFSMSEDDSLLLREKFSSRRFYDDSGDHSLSAIHAGLGDTGQQIQKMEFDFDNLGNVLYRKDMRTGFGLVENFEYDELNRMTQSAVVGGATLDVAYDSQGNIKTRDVMTSSGVDARTYTYGSSRPHAVTSVTSSQGSWSYGYDANGSIKDRHGVSNAVEWTAYNKVSKVVDGTDESVFTHDANHRRITHTVKEGGSDKRRTIYSGPMEQIEEKVSGDWKTVRTRVHVGTPTGTGVVVVDTDTQGNLTAQDLWMHTDHLGSICEITDQEGAIVKSFSFDAWGNRRDHTDWGWIDPATVDPTYTERGFTGHEMLDEVGLVHMNGRIYDAVLGRFLSADPFVQFSDNGQSFNRYSYVLNNPIKFTDPSGHFLFIIPAVVGAIAAHAAAGVTILGLSAAVSSALIVGVAVAVSTIGIAFAAGATAGEALKQGAIAFALAAGTAGIGSYFNGLAEGVQISVATAKMAAEAGNNLLVLIEVARAVSHGIYQGGFAELAGGDFVSGFAAAFTSSITGSIMESEALGPLLGGSGIIAIAARTISASAISGAASEISGGKFANGAVTGAFVHLLNGESPDFIDEYDGTHNEDINDQLSATVTADGKIVALHTDLTAQYDSSNPGSGPSVTIVDTDSITVSAQEGTRIGIGVLKNEDVVVQVSKPLTIITKPPFRLGKATVTTAVFDGKTGVVKYTDLNHNINPLKTIEEIALRELAFDYRVRISQVPDIFKAINEANYK